MTTLARTLGFRDLSLLIVGSVIGSGIFISPGAVLRQVDGLVAPALLVWFAGGGLSLLGALTYGELSARKPEAGGLYIYIRDCFGRFPAFMFGWTLFFVISSGSVATLAVAFSTYLGAIVPISPVMARAVSIGMIAAMTVVNVRSTRQSADLQNWTTAIKVGAIIIMSVLLLWVGRGYTATSAAMWPADVERSLATGFGLAMISVLWAYEGWQYATYSAGETLDSQRNFPRAFLLGVAVLITVYMLANVSYLAALGPTPASQTDSIAATSVAAIAGPTAAKFVALAILISIFSAANSTVLTAPRVFYAMARDGLFFRRLSDVHPRFGTPAFAIIASSMWAALLAATGTFEQLLTYVVFIGWIFYALSAACVFVYRKRAPEQPIPYRVPGYPYTPLLFIIAAAALVANTIAAKPLDAVVGLAIVMLGAPAYLVWRAGSRKAATVGATK
jgi:APA family basic amino acid/polyamine antiporter